MPSITTRPALTGKFATTLEAVAEAQNTSTAAVLRQLMTDAWGENLENAPTTPATPTVMTVKPDCHGRQSHAPSPVATPSVAADDLFAQSA